MKETITCKCGHCYFSIEKTKENEVDVLLLHCKDCGITTWVAPIDYENLDVWCPDNTEMKLI